MSTTKPRRVPDAQFEHGEVAVITADTRASRAVGRGTRTFHRGTKVIISRPGREYVRARVQADGSSSYVWTIDARLLAPIDRPLRHLGDVPDSGIAADDPRLDYLWRDAAALADMTGHCSEYDRLCDVLGIPGRERSFAVRIQVAQGVELRGTVVARSYAEAERILLRQVNSPTAQLALESATR